MNKERIKGIFIGMAIMVILSFSMDSSFAQAIKKNIEVVYSDIKVVIDGKQIEPKNSNGETVEPFLYEGTTYLPVRAISEGLGKQVSWDQNTKTVFIGERPKDSTTGKENNPSTSTTNLEIKKKDIVRIKFNLGDINLGKIEIWKSSIRDVKNIYGEPIKVDYDIYEFGQVYTYTYEGIKFDFTSYMDLDGSLGEYVLSDYYLLTNKYTGPRGGLSTLI